MDENGGDAYPQFRKYSRTVYKNGESYSNNQTVTIRSAVVRRITSTTAELRVQAASNMYFYYKQGEASSVSEICASNLSCRFGSDGVIITNLSGLSPNTEYTYSLVVSKVENGKTKFSDVKFVTFRTAQAAPEITDISIDYEKEELKNRASEPLEFAESDNSSSWTTIPVKGYISLTEILDNSRTIRQRFPCTSEKKQVVPMQPARRQRFRFRQDRKLNKRNSRYCLMPMRRLQFQKVYSMYSGKTSPTDWKSRKQAQEQLISLLIYMSS